MSFTKTVFFVNSATTKVVEVPLTDESAISYALNDELQADDFNTVLAAGQNFQLVSGLYSSPRLNKDDITSAVKTAYSAGTAQVIKPTIVLEDDLTCFVKLIDVTDGREKFNITTFEANAADATAAALLVGAEILKLDNVSGVGYAAGVITITFVKDVIYRAAANAASSIDYDTDAILSVGSAAEVAAARTEGLAYKGVNPGGTNIVQPTLAAAVNSDKITLEVVSTVGDRKDRHEIVVYVKAGGTAAYSDLATIFGAS
jgi:hypothetical protein